jgi:hypothetical protein
MRQDVDLVAPQKLVAGGAKSRPSRRTDDDGAERREEVGELPERRVQDRAILVERDAQKLRLPVHEAFGVEGRGRRQRRWSAASATSRSGLMTTSMGMWSRR